MMTLLKSDQNSKMNKLREIILHAMESSALYKAKYEDFNLIDDFENEFNLLPFLSRDDYYLGMKGPEYNLLAGGLTGSYIFTSGGTTGDVKLTAWSPDFVNNWVDECYRSLTAVGLQRGDIVLNLFFPGIWATHTLINKALEKANTRIIPLGGKHSLEVIVSYIKKFNVTALIGVPSFVVRLTEYVDSLPEEDKSTINIKKIFHAGEFLSQGQADFIRDSLNCQINPFIYSSTDTGTIGMKCPHCKTNQYHLAETMYLEIFDLETGEPVGTEKSGEFVVTSLVNKKAPCIRYRVGDMGLLEEGSCPCGNPAPLLTIMGRADDEVKVAGYLVSPAIIQKGLEQFPEISRNFQLIVEEIGKKAKLTIVCETVPSSLTLSNDTTDKIAESLVKSYDILEVLVKQGYCMPLEVQILKSGGIPKNPRTGKIKRVRDLR